MKGDPRDLDTFNDGFAEEPGAESGFPPCPYCGSPEWYFGSWEGQPDGADADATCEDCGERFYVHYVALPTVST